MLKHPVRTILITILFTSAVTVAALKWGLVPGRGVNSDTVQWGLIMREGPKIEEI